MSGWMSGPQRLMVRILLLFTKLERCIWHSLEEMEIEAMTSQNSHEKLPTSLKISTDHAQVVINGECVTDNDVENFRNYVSGALGLKSPSEFKERNIKFIAHDILSFTMNYTNKIDVLQNMGFFTVLDDAAWDYPCDGVVYRCNDWQKCQNLGYTSKYPRFAVALKSRETITAVTTLKEVLWTVGRTGVVSPTGVVDP